MAIEPGPQFYMHRLGGSIPAVQIAAVDPGGEAIMGSMTRHLDTHGAHRRPEDHDTLFRSVKAGPWRVNHLHAHPEMGVHVPTVLGALDEVASRTSSRGAVPSYNLSAYSSRLVDKLAKKGLVEARDTEDGLNDYTRAHGAEISNEVANKLTKYGSPMPPNEVKYARDRGRKKIFGKPSKSSETPTKDQGTLF